jgi:hypothetical protein
MKASMVIADPISSVYQFAKIIVCGVADASTRRPETKRAGGDCPDIRAVPVPLIQMPRRQSS